jgi:Putative peptidoglycan binding domain
MKSKGLIFISCLAVGALIVSPASAKPVKKSAGKSMSNTTRMAAHTTRATPGYHYKQGMSSRVQGTQYYGRTGRAASGYYGGRQYSATRYVGRSGYYGGNNYYGGTPYYYGSGWGYGSSSVWPYVAASAAPYVASSLWAPGYSGYPYSYYSGGYPYSYYGGYPNNYSYYGSGYGYRSGYGHGYAGSTVAAVQQRLGQLGYYRGGVDGVIGPRTRSAIAAFESRNGLVVDGTISRPLLNRLGLA